MQRVTAVALAQDRLSVVEANAHGDATDIDVYEWVAVAEAVDQRQHRVDGGFVAADQHAPTTEVAQVLDGALGLLG